MAERLKNNPIRLTVLNGITMDVEITKSDLKTIVSKASRDNKFNAIKNALAKDIPSYLHKSTYLGWRSVQEGKHGETAYFAYFDRNLGVRTIPVMRKMKNGGPYKPYAIIDEYVFGAAIGTLQKELRFNGLACRTDRGSCPTQALLLETKIRPSPNSTKLFCHFLSSEVGFDCILKENSTKTPLFSKKVGISLCPIQLFLLLLSPTLEVLCRFGTVDALCNALSPRQPTPS